MFKRLKEINIDKMENKILLGQVIIWFILVSFKDIIPSYLNIYIYWGIFMLATHICMKNKKVLIPIGIYLIFAFLTEPFIDSSYLRELINRTTGILIGSLSILYFFKDSERQVPIQVERLATYMMALLYFGSLSLLPASATASLAKAMERSPSMPKEPSSFIMMG